MELKMKSTAQIAVQDVTFGYFHQPVLRNVSVSFRAGEVVSLLGPNGSGKTTLLKIVLGLFAPQSGEVLLEGRPVRAMAPKQLARRIAYVPQFHRITFGYRVLDAVLMGRLPHKPFFFRYGGEDEQVAVRALERLGIEHLKDRPYTEVSGGERQLVLIARALAQGADIFVMDEPVNGLDYGNQIRLLARIADLSRSGYTFIKTTHFPDHALWVSNRVVMLKEGCVVADGPAAKTINKATLYQLYNTRVDVVGLNGGGRICVPHALGRYGHRRPSGKHHEFSKRVRVAG
jgi:iron complex transport system ATP-binding protein